MADQKISQLNNITGANVDDATDELAIVDASGNETKAITRGELFKSVDGTTFHVDSTNNRVGIGTASPTEKLDVSGNIRTTGNVEVTGNIHSPADNNLLVLYGGDVFDGAHLVLYGSTASVPNNAIMDADIHRFRSQTGSEYARFTAAGNFGIGTTSPSAPMDIRGTTRIGGGSSYDMKLQGNVTPAVTVGGSTSAAIISSFGTGTLSGHVGVEVPSNDSNDGFYIATDANNDGTVDTLAMKIDAAGNVGIKKSSPGADLDVNGDVFIGRAFTTFRTGLTISGGAVTATGSYHTIDTESSAASDDLDTINGAFATGHRLVITAANSGRTVVVKDGTGNILLNNVTGDFSMDNTADTMELIWNGGNWLELSRSNNGA